MKWLLTALLLFNGSAWAWDGFDYQTSSFIEIDKGNRVREGETIDYFDYKDSEYKQAIVESVSKDEVELMDIDSGTIRTFDME